MEVKASGTKIPIQKLYVTPQDLSEKSFELGRKVLDSKFAPHWIIALWRGGAPVGMTVQEFLKYHGLQTDHIAIRTSSYFDIGEQTSAIRVHGLEYIVKHANENDRLLIVDDIFDSGRSLKAVLEKLKRKMRANTPKDIRIATVFYKPENNKTDITPDFYVETTNKWVIFGHELQGMTLEEIAKTKGDKIASCMKISKEV